MEQTQCSETSAIKHLTQEKIPKITHDTIRISGKPLAVYRLLGINMKKKRKFENKKEGRF
jgi:hypothetical protein